ncbi:hypothetical protein ACLIR7_13095 [Nitratireductor aquimarinus]|uniref:hypothetical protein n=1 Tax=Nitratireductor aquimarinus TaxID=889300 RepID=UPI00398F61A7
MDFTEAKVMRANSNINRERRFNPSPISPVVFAQKMKEHWEKMGNCSSEPLLQQWKNMGDALGRATLVGACAKSRKETSGQWQALKFPTGTGKTQGLCIYASLVAKQNVKLEAIRRTGILVVTPFIREADGIATKINHLAGRECAVARHRDNPVEEQVLRKHDVVVITHQAYLNALEDEVLQRGMIRLSQYLEWEHGPRHLTVIDERLAELVRSYSITADDLRFIAAQIDGGLRQKFPAATEVILRDVSAVEKIEEVFQTSLSDIADATTPIWDKGSSEFSWMAKRDEFHALRRAMLRKKHDNDILRYEDKLARSKLRERVDNVFLMLEAMRAGGGYRSRTKGKITIHSPQLLIPKELPGPVILDATASQDPLWELLGDRLSLVPEVEGVRSYKNVTLRVAWIENAGKHSLVRQKEKNLTNLFDSISKDLAGKRVFVCLHKELEPLALQQEHSFADCAIDHWGNTVGRNDWRDFEAAVLFGLPYLPDSRIFDIVQAVRSFAIETDAVPDWSDAELRKSLHNKHLASSIVQTMNRIRCRQVIDSEGNCPPADIFLTLPVGKRGENILERVKLEMPDIKVREWKLLPKVINNRKRRRKPHYEEPLIRLLQQHSHGEILLTDICKDLGLTKTARKDLLADLRIYDHPITKALRDMKIYFHPVPRGRGSGSYFFKTGGG